MERTGKDCKLPSWYVMAKVCEERASIAQTEMEINSMCVTEQCSFPVSPD